ncbi:TetR/AcrR family transcriptional regulator [Amycolatopsis sp. NPDC059021]|uniref:TetR/AcrR family transcriptional regulator n=1 Tax=Amycolatopsis sp. NPDC059021 TaxID=3346704 RepID=UPI00366A9910
MQEQRMPRLSGQDWARAALEAIAHGGLAAVAVEPLARKLGVTKGSFYAHYNNRDELVVAALAEWERTHGQDGLAEFAATTEPAERLRQLVSAAARAGTGLAPSVLLSLLAERSDERVHAVLGRVNQARLDLLVRTYRELGLSPAQARHRARIAYATVLGLLQLSQQDPGTSPRGPQLTSFIHEATAMLVPHRD